MATPVDTDRSVEEIQTVARSVLGGADETVSSPAAGAPTALPFGPPAGPGEVGCLGPYRIVKGRWLLAGLAALLVAAVAGVIIIIKNKDGTETRIEVPDGATVTVKDKGGKTLAQVAVPVFRNRTVSAVEVPGTRVGHALSLWNAA